MPPESVPSKLPTSGVRPADRLGFTLFLAAVLHLTLILGVTFSFSTPGQVSKSLEITLASFKSDKAPEKADFLAQENQQGSGSLEHKAAPKTTQQALFQDQQVRKVTPPSAPPPAQTAISQKTVVATRTPKPEKTPTEQKHKQPAKPLQQTAAFDSSELSNAIASLEAELAQDVQRYAKRPKIQRLNAASTMRDKGAWYKDEWRKKVERVGNLNYPPEARQNRIYGSLRLLVSINRDGTLYEVQILESSGQPILDQAALRIVRLAAPYSPFTGDLNEFDRLEIIRTWRFDRGDRLSSQ
ncbi:energy transducer TonB [Pseudomonas sp. N040]|uniref:energy transducer TonB n=1 Tax=Pseudomonas sp. N040 TaxID=2785325 RepID=UPI0018A2CCDB|nr:energy transducer TonB [Pseudomonas sp. N040]MBF7729994.1 energy transducer TonB [Pseudomonas sp. N040]MBW7013636.1 energy transducer TonB [Pseudomonas sp. N040]